MIRRFDRWFSAWSVSLAERNGRRAFLARLGASLVGTVALPLLPVARNGLAVADQSRQGSGDYNNQKSCDYWAYCSIGASMCHCCGGTASSCPPGSQPSPITWVGTCKNPDDGKSYVVSYNDCCGASACGRCLCSRNEDDLDRLLPQRNSPLAWCVGVAPNYQCTVARVMTRH